MTDATPQLPAKKKGAAAKKPAKQAAPSSKTLPILQAQYITLEDGTNVPIKIPPGMPADQAQQVVEFLRSNPEAAKAIFKETKGLLRTPGLANALVNMQNNAQPNPEQLQNFHILKDDPEFKEMFEDIQTHGPQALQKYWEDTDMMTRISQKLAAVKLQESEASSSSSGAADDAARAPATRSSTAAREVKTLHDAAKVGDAKAAARLIENGSDVNEQNDKGITPLGVAVGFNRQEVVQLLLDNSADVMLRDAQGNTVLHYAAGYGRTELVGLLLDAGAELQAENNAQQKPIDVAKMNGEKKVVKLLLERILGRGEAATA